ncbi:MAG: hypothetical protein HN353_05690 [Bdellovibrionales bacterium]|jgi:hypothetical protein|nr:hypothetical protein [Bdellovibrionales bacterium]MBT3525065.1 hypothetical protein [Bdellovibrionales bacterium]MBT7669758.1 hypothetical protein [Bdellovibrionales bacterium]MBT7767414.1 hypothetical protein [Bdellovibrionales bacterium]
MKKWLSLFTVFSLLFSLTLFADETKKSDEKSVDKKEENTTEAVSSASLRASLGSMSKLSISAGVGYTGSSIRKPFENQIPNPNGLQGDYSTYFSGSLSGRYRIDNQSTTSIGGSFTFRPDPQGDSKTSEFTNPFVGYSWVRKYGPVVLSQGVDYTKFTRKDTLDRGFHSEVSYGATLIWGGINGTPFSLGLSTSAYHDLFTDGSNSASAYNNWQDDYGFGIYPFAEFQASDRFTLRTVVGKSFYHLRSDLRNSGMWDKFEEQKLYQTVGLGISITKVIYLYNYVKFYPQMNFFDKKNDSESFNSTANYGISLTMSLF